MPVTIRTFIIRIRREDELDADVAAMDLDSATSRAIGDGETAIDDALPEGLWSTVEEVRHAPSD